MEEPYLGIMTMHMSIIIYNTTKRPKQNLPPKIADSASLVLNNTIIRHIFTVFVLDLSKSICWLLWEWPS